MTPTTGSNVRFSLGAAALPLIAAFAACSATPDASRAAMKPEEAGGYRGNPNKPYGQLAQDLTAIELLPQDDGRYTLRAAPTPGAPEWKDVDLRWFVPRVPAIAKGNETLTRVALMQREFNRNETKFGAVGDFAESKIANNCLRAGLWELVLEKKKDDGSTGMVYHGWFDFPLDHYAKVFQAANGMSFDAARALVLGYPAFSGFKFPVDQLRTVEREVVVPAAQIDQHLGDKLQRLPEQTRKAHLVLNPGIETYGDYVKAENQPIRVAEFSEPGYYNLDKPVAFDLAWMGAPESIAWRRVKGVQAPVGMQELEIRYAGGQRIVIGDEGLVGLPVRDAAPTKDSECLRLTFGIGTPDIYASLAERKAEFESGRQNYLLLLDRDGNHLDNHLGGCDRAFLWRDATSLHIWLLGYERMTIVSHLSIPWQAP